MLSHDDLYRQAATHRRLRAEVEADPETWRGQHGAALSSIVAEMLAMPDRQLADEVDAGTRLQMALLMRRLRSIR